VQRDNVHGDLKHTTASLYVLCPVI